MTQMEEKSLMPISQVTSFLCCMRCKIHKANILVDHQNTDARHHTDTQTHKHSVHPSSSLRMLSRSFRAFQAWSFSFLVGVRFFCLAAMMRRKPSITSLSDTRTLCLSSCLRISSLANLRDTSRRGEAARSRFLK